MGKIMTTRSVLSFAMLLMGCAGLTCGLCVTATATAPPPTAKKQTVQQQTKELSQKAIAALDILKKREKGYIQKAKIALMDCISAANPNSPEQKSIADQCGFFLIRVVGLEYNEVNKEYNDLKTDPEVDPAKKALGKRLDELHKQNQIWLETFRIAPPNVAQLNEAWTTIQRNWLIEDAKKKIDK